MPIEMSSAEIVATIKHSNEPFVLIEGKEDAIIFRHLMEDIGFQYFAIQTCGGRNTLLEIFKRKDEFSHINTLFFADQDMWIFSGIPSEFENISFTQGYSLENDLFIDGKRILDNLLKKKELAAKESLLRSLSKWFACEVEKYSTNPQDNYLEKVKLLDKNVIKENESVLSAEFLDKVKFKEPDNELFESILANYQTHLRGKFLIQMYTRIMRDRNTNAKEGEKEVFYEERQLIDLCFREGIATENSCMQRIKNLIKSIIFKPL
jgi:hypothetical protein